MLTVYLVAVLFFVPFWIKGMTCEQDSRGLCVEAHAQAQGRPTPLGADELGVLPVAQE